jgi:hypothetical protein
MINDKRLTAEELMTYYLVEDPTMFIFLGILIEAVLGIALFRTGRGFLIWIMLGVLVVCLTGIIGQRFIITERKRVVQTLDGIVVALEANDVEKTLTYLEPEAAHSRERARWALGRVEVQSASYRKLDVQINMLTSPPTAKVQFFGLINYRDRRGEIPYNNYASNFTINLRKHGDRWLVQEHQEENEYR